MIPHVIRLIGAEVASASVSWEMRTISIQAAITETRASRRVHDITAAFRLVSPPLNTGCTASMRHISRAPRSKIAPSQADEGPLSCVVPGLFQPGVLQLHQS